MPPQNIDMTAIQQAIARRSGTPSTNQGPTMPIGAQASTPLGPSATGGSATPTVPSATMARPPTPQPNFSSPFAGPTPQAGNGFDEETKKTSKILIQKLLQVL